MSVERWPFPAHRGKTQLYSKRYIRHMPAAGEVILFDRSWYNRAGVERVEVTNPEATQRPIKSSLPIWDGVSWLRVSETER